MTSTGLLDGRYELGEEIGRGGMGEVYRARDSRLGRDVAVKFLRDAPTADARRFEAEWKTLAGFSRPNLVRLYDAGECDGRAFIVMELVEGTTLAKKMNGAPLPPGEVADVAESISRALAYVHAKGVVHRDIKPGNILLGEDGGVWLADFGVARLVDTTGLTATGLAIGTPAYLAPEQVEGIDVGPAADVYALGLVLLEALTGRRAYQGTASEMTAARLHHGPELGPELSTGWREILGSMTARSPGARPTAGEVAVSLEGELGGDVLPADATLIGLPTVVGDLTPTAVLAPEAPTALYEAPPLGARDGETAVMTAAAAGRNPLRRRAVLISALAVLGVGVLLAVLLGGGGHSPSGALGATGATTTTAPPTTTSTTTTSTTTTTTTLAVTATAPVAKAADSVLSVLQSGIADGGIAQNAGMPLINTLEPLLIAGNTGAQQGAFDQLLNQVDQGVSSGAINGATASALTPVLGSLASALGVSSTAPTNPTPTNPAPPFPPGHKGHGHGQDQKGD